jgi:hypothetical protein
MAHSTITWFPEALVGREGDRPIPASELIAMVAAASVLERASTEEIQRARFWAEEFACTSLEETVWTLYAYVCHWHNAADALAGKRGPALARFPPPSVETLHADFIAARADIKGR